MNKKIVIGIPKALLYYKYKVLWKEFFNILNIKTIESINTNKELIKNGINYSVDESCLPYKIYIGHVNYLINRCDYIFVPRIVDYGRNKKMCIKYNGLYDNVKTLFPKEKIITINIDKKNNKYEFIEYIKLGLKFNKNIIKIIYAYIRAKNKQNKYNIKETKDQNKKLNQNKIKILIVSHPYVIHDEYIGKPIKKILSNMNIRILYTDKYNKKINKKIIKKISPTLYWKNSKETVNSIYYYKNKVDGIIFLSAFPCGLDSLVNELLIRKLKDIPVTNILLDENNITTGIETRLESFIDILKERKRTNE